MKFVSRRAALVLSFAACGAAGLGVTDKLLIWPPGSPTRALASKSHLLAAAPAELATSAPATTDVVSTLVQTAATLPTCRGTGRAQHGYRDGRYTGPPVDAYYGLLRVRVDVRGGRITSVHALQYPSDNPTSRYINAHALPVLESEVIRAQNVFVYMISGATLSSNAFLRSTYFAIRRACV